MTEITLPAPARVGQATAVEQARAIAEVHAQISVARQLPRDIQTARRTALDSCAIAEFAARAFYRYPRGGSTITGASVYLARELARCWGNIDYGIKELSRDDDHGQSEMLAFAWDMESNARNSNVFIVPHKRDKKGGPEPLVDMRDIYENNANNGARRVREAIRAVLPPWFWEAAVAACHKTNKDGGGMPIADRIANMLTMFTQLRVSEKDIERKLGRPSSKWTGDDVAVLGVIFNSIQRGEIDRDDEFPPEVVTAQEITAGAPPAERPAEARHPAEGGDGGVFHDRGHITPGSSITTRTSWDPDCTLCTGDETGRTHYYSHTNQVDTNCSHCQREQAWDASEQDGPQ